MDIQLLHRQTGKLVTFNHPVDARAALESGFYVKPTTIIPKPAEEEKKEDIIKEEIPEGASVADELVMKRGNKKK